MMVLILVPFFCVGVSGSPALARLASFSGEFGGDSGEYFDHSSNELDGPVTALKIRANDRYLLSIQVRYGDSWSVTEGSTVGNPSGMELYHGEGFIQVTGRFGNYVEYLAFRTNLGRVFAFGPSFGPGMGFEAEPMFPNTVLLRQRALGVFGQRSWVPLGPRPRDRGWESILPFHRAVCSHRHIDDRNQ